MEDNQNATINDINDKSQEFQKWIDDTFEKMEQVVKAATEKELLLISESKQKLEECLVKINKTLYDPKYEEYLVDTEKEIINNYCAEANDLLNKSNLSQKEMDKRRNAIEENCYSIFAQIKIKIQARENKREEMELQKNLTLLGIFTNKVFNVTSELVLTDKISSHEETRIIIKTRGSCETYYGNILEIYQPLKELEKQQNKEAKNDLTNFVDYVKSLATCIQSSDDYKVSIINKCDEVTQWIPNNKEASKSDYDLKKEEVRNVSQPMFDKQKKKEQKEARRSLINYVRNTRDYILNPANKDRLPPPTQTGLINSCESVLSWTSNNESFGENLYNLSQRVNKDIVNLKNKDENYTQLQNEVDKITEWISANKTAVKSEYESKMEELEEIQQYVSDKLSEQEKIKNRMRKEEEEQQRSARQAFKNYVLEVHDYLDSITEERLSSREKRPYLLQCKVQLTWMRDHQTLESVEFEQRRNSFKKNVVPIFDNLKQEDMDAHQKLHALHKDIKNMIDGTGTEELVDKDKLQRACSDIIAWIIKHPKASMTDYEYLQNNLQQIKKQYQHQLQQKNQL
uniref:structural maintenance of chromosomes protein 4-like n=1 Tax=Styela clava TaxID=7725 RepID=UPI001939DB33|nr:structural maintenance of chromosomes protein 4-like [Styela clava]